MMKEEERRRTVSHYPQTLHFGSTHQFLSAQQPGFFNLAPLLQSLDEQTPIFSFALFFYSQQKPPRREGYRTALTGV
jgi:hypothetical protein